MSHFKLPKSLVNREQFLLSLSAHRTVLHLGCADFPYTEEQISSGRWLHNKLCSVASTCTGVDLNLQAITLLKEKHGVHNIIEGNVENLEVLGLKPFDLVVAGEIIEHLNNPGLFLNSVRSVLRADGNLVVTTTNAFCFRRFVRIPFGSESVHPDHTYYYSHTTLKTLASRFGFNLIEAVAYGIPEDGPVIPYFLDRMAAAITPNWAEGIIHVYGLSGNYTD